VLRLTDGHVEWTQTPYIGALRRGGTIRDHIYRRPRRTWHLQRVAVPGDRFDAVMMPTDHQGGR
jgi:hypothetical protein